MVPEVIAVSVHDAIVFAAAIVKHLLTSLLHAADRGAFLLTVYTALHVNSTTISLHLDRERGRESLSPSTAYNCPITEDSSYSRYAEITVLARMDAKKPAEK